jgi:hypothetical protein
MKSHRSIPVAGYALGGLWILLLGGLLLGTTSSSRVVASQQAPPDAAEAPANARGRDDGPSRYNFPLVDHGSRRMRLEHPGRLAKQQRRLVAPSVDDERRYEEFLRQKGTGLVRLFAYDASIVDGYTTAAQPNAVASVWGGGAFYSFTHRTHVSRQWTEVVFTDGYLVGDVSRDSLGVFIELGEISIDSVTLDHEAAMRLARSQPPHDRDGLTAERKRLATGRGSGQNPSYVGRVRARAGTTFVLRSVLYDRVDTLLVGRVVRVGDDSSITVVWRRLARYDVIDLARRVG